MTGKQLRKLEHGTKVQWHRPDDPAMDCEGYVCTNHRKKPTDEDIYIQWEDGQRTYAFDVWAIRYASIKM